MFVMFIMTNYWLGMYGGQLDLKDLYGRLVYTRQLSLLVDGPRVRLVALPILHT